jgi:hypothetical protein
MTNVDLTKQILVKVSDDLDKEIERSCVEYRKQSGENVSKPEMIRKIVQFFFNSKELNIKESFQKEAIKARVGKLANFVLDSCRLEVERGALTHTVYITNLNLLKFLVDDKYYNTDVFNKQFVLEHGYINHDYQKYAPFINQIVSELKLATGLEISSTHDAERLVLKISWLA